MKKQKSLFKLLRAAVVSAFVMAGFVLTGCPSPTEVTQTTGSITGNVVFLSDTGGITVTIELETMGGQLIDSVEITDDSSEDGSFRFDGLDPGTYVLRMLSETPLVSITRNVPVTAGGESSVTINIGCNCTHGNAPPCGCDPATGNGCDCTHGNVGCGCTEANHCNCTHGNAPPCGCDPTAGNGCDCTHGNAPPCGCSLTAGDGCDCAHGNAPPCGCSLTAGDGCDCTHGNAPPCGCSLTAGDGCDCTLGNFCGCSGNAYCDCAPGVATEIELSRTTPLRLRVYDFYYLYATVFPENTANQMVVWVSSNPYVVSVVDSMVPRFGISGPESAVRIMANAPGTATITATAMATGNVERRASLTVTVPRRPSVTITGIPYYYQRGDVSVRLSWQNLETGWYNWDWESSIRSNITFTLDSFAGSHDFRLLFDGDDGMGYFLSARNITAGANTIPFSEFTPLVPISITITGIPSHVYNYGNGEILLLYPGTLNTIGGGGIVQKVDSTTIWDSSVTFTMPAIPSVYPGLSDVHLRIWDFDWNFEELLGAYSVASVNINAMETTIPFTTFDIFEPITITVTEIPSQYFDWGGSLGLYSPGVNVWSNWVNIGDSTAFTLFAMPGVYVVSLSWGHWDSDYMLWRSSSYSIPSRNITAGNNIIPFEAFGPPWHSNRINALTESLEPSNQTMPNSARSRTRAHWRRESGHCNQGGCHKGRPPFLSRLSTGKAVSGLDRTSVVNFSQSCQSYCPGRRPKTK